MEPLSVAAKPKVAMLMKTASADAKALFSCSHYCCGIVWIACSGNAQQIR